VIKIGILLIMEDIKKILPDYMNELSDRGKTSRVYESHQLTGLRLTELLEDPKHKSLYMRLAKLNDNQQLISLAERVAERKHIKNKGAYFMKIWYKKDEDISREK
jgi:hypothetical protein